MATVLDHTIVPVQDRQRSVDFYTRIFGFDDLGEVGPFLAVRVNDTLNFDFRQSDDFRSIHYAFAMESDEFEAAFARIKESGIPYGDNPQGAGQHEGPGNDHRSQGYGEGGLFQGPRRARSGNKDPTDRTGVRSVGTAIDFRLRGE